tara:strand:+ start:411 stop:521 length:111 start_codon:yes stop_codon:yes gene_type:complete
VRERGGSGYLQIGKESELENLNKKEKRKKASHRVAF